MSAERHPGRDRGGETEGVADVTPIRREPAERTRFQLPAPDAKRDLSTIAAVAAALAVAAVLFLFLSPTTVSYGLVIDGDRPTVSCAIAPDVADEVFGDAKQHHCDRSRANRLLRTGQAAVGLGAVVLVLGLVARARRPVQRDRAFRLRVGGTAGAATLLVVAGLALLWVGFTGRRLNPAPKPLTPPASTALAGDDDVIAVVEASARPSIGDTRSPPNSTRWVLLAGTEPDALVDRLAEQRYSLTPGDEIERGAWYDWWSSSVRVGTLDALAEAPPRGWDAVDLRELLAELAADAGAARTVTVVAFTTG